MAKRKHGDKPGKFPAPTMTEEQAYAEHPANRKRHSHGPLSCERRYRSLGSFDGKAVENSNLEQANKQGRQTGWSQHVKLSPALRGVCKRFGNK